MSWLLLVPDNEVETTCSRAAELEIPAMVEPIGGNLIEATTAALDSGVRRIAVSGTDANVNQVVSAMLTHPASKRGRVPASFPEDPMSEASEASLILGLLDSRGGLAQTLGISGELEQTIKHLQGDSVWGLLDVGEYATSQSKGYMVSSLLIEAGALATRWRARRARCRVELEGMPARGRPGRAIQLQPPIESVSLAAVMNAQFVNGVRLATRAVPHDGLLDVSVSTRRPAQLRSALQRLTRGGHADGHIQAWLAKRVWLTSESPLEVVVDQMRVGKTPVEISVRSTRIALKI